MRYAIISDVHSNLQALEAALKAIDEQDVDKIICLGDIVGYNANPCECLDLVREKADVIIQGNHDNMVAVGMPLHGIHQHARAGLEYASEQLSDDQMKWLEGLPEAHKDGDFYAVHGHPGAPFEYILYHSDAASAIRALKRMDYSLCFFGHSHMISHAYTKGDNMKFYLNNPKRNNPYRERLFDVGAAINGEEFILLNCGAIGQPRDHNPHSFGVFDDIRETVEIIEFDYDRHAAMKAIMDAGYKFCDKIAQRLDPYGETLVNKAWSPW